MDDSVVKEIARMQNLINELHDEIDNGCHMDRRPDCLTANTLESISLYLKKNPDRVKPEECLVVCELDKVTLYSSVKGAKNNRHAILEVKPVVFDKFQNDRFLSQSEMIVQLLTRCVRTEEIKNLVQSISSMSYIEEGSSDDDGVKADLMISAKILCNNGKPVPNVILKPYRIFPEVEQPRSQYLVRVEAQVKVPHVALYLADGGMWKVLAIETIKTHLKKILPEGISIIS